MDRDKQTAINIRDEGIRILKEWNILSNAHAKPESKETTPWEVSMAV